MGTRLELHELLKSLSGCPNVYFQEPENTKMDYPCIKYNLENDRVNHADNHIYKRKNRYSVMVIDRSSVSKIPDKIRDIPYCSFDRTYRADGLSHFVFTVYF